MLYEKVLELGRCEVVVSVDGNVDDSDTRQRELKKRKLVRSKMRQRVFQINMTAIASTSTHLIFYFTLGGLSYLINRIKY